MQSAFSAKRPSAGASIPVSTDENYDLKGLNYVAPDQVMPRGETPMLLNSRRYADDADETAVAQHTRKGSIPLSTPIGEAVNVTNVATSTGMVPIVPDLFDAVKFTPSASGCLTRITLSLKKAANTRGFVVVELWSASNDLPDSLVSQSSIAPSLIGSSFADATAYFIDAPALVSGTSYFLVVHMRELGAGTYYLNKTAGSTGYTSLDGKNWTIGGYGIRNSIYLSTPGKILGFTKRYPEVAAHRTVFGFNAGIYQMADSPTTPTLVETYTDPAATFVRFANVDETTFWCDGFGHGRQWDGTTVSDITNYPSANGYPINMIIYQNRLLTIPANDPTRIDFTALYNFTDWPSVNFFYIDRPNTPDSITAWCLFQQGLTVFTKRTKWSITGSDITNITPTPHAGTRGAISQEAIAVGTEGIYFMSDDMNIYRWNGVADTLLSKKIQPELKKILDPSKVRLHLYNNKLRVYYNRNPDPEVQYMLLLDVVENEWYKDTGRPVAGSMEWEFDDGQLVEFSSQVGWLFTGEQGYSDLGKAIDWKYWTAYHSTASGYAGYGGGSAKTRVKKFHPVVRPSNADYYLSVGRDLDFANQPVMSPYLVSSSGSKWGTFEWGDGTKYGSSKIVTKKSPMSGRGAFWQYRFEHDVIEDPVALFGYIAQVKPGKQR